MNDNKTPHVLKLSCGLTLTLLLDEETGEFDCEWSERPTKKSIA